MCTLLQGTRVLHIALLICITAGSAESQEGSAQQERERDDVHLRNDCRLAAQVLTHGRPANKREWALGTIPRCDESGPPVLARMWRDARGDSATLAQLIYRSVGLRDRRLYGVVAEQSRDPSLPPLKRAAALSLLGRWARPGTLTRYSRYFAPDYAPAERHGGVSPRESLFLDHDTQVEGAEPLPSTILDEVVVLLRSASQNDADFRVRATANNLLWNLQR